MLRLSILLVTFFTFSISANATTNKEPNNDYLSLEIEKIELEEALFSSLEFSEIVSIESIELYEVDEEVVLPFHTEKYLPNNFVPNKGIYDLDWNTIELVEVEEEIDLGLNPKDYLPKNFNPSKGLVCSKSELVTASF